MIYFILMQYPEILFLTEGRFTSDGAGVRIKRILPVFKNFREILEINPFLLLDEFKSEKEEDYKNGFPMHPHKGFQTITYMKWGSFEHRDSLGNSGIINQGGIQWMVAGSGIEHSEMPIINNDKKIWGYQLWFNLPAKYKLIEPFYKNIQQEEIPIIPIKAGEIKILFGKTNYSSISGGENPYWKLNYFDVIIYPQQSIRFDISQEDYTLCYVYENHLYLNLRIQNQSQDNPYLIKENQLVALHNGNIFEVKNPSDKSSRFLFLNSPRLEEPIVRYGPFVMNTEKEIIEAIHQFQF